MCAVPCGWGRAPPLGSVLVILQGNIVDAPNPSVPHGCLRQDRGDPYHQLGPPGRGQISPTPLGEWVWFCKVLPAVIPTYRRMCSVGCWGTRLMRRTIFPDFIWGQNWSILCVHHSAKVIFTRNSGASKFCSFFRKFLSWRMLSYSMLGMKKYIWYIQIDGLRPYAGQIPPISLAQ